jgi:catechol-2,3-dioxygenase
MTDEQHKKARAVGMNHVALEVDDIDEALAFYGGFLEFSLRSRSERAAFIDLGDQFINFSTGRHQDPDKDRHMGLVVDDKEAVRECLKRMGVELLPGGGVDFLDPWGNRIQIVAYGNIQFSKTPEVLEAMGLGGLEKSAKAIEELAKKGMAPK